MSAPPHRRLEQIRKRSGALAPYDEAKIAAAIHRAALAVGVDNRYLGQDLAGVVTHYLENYHHGTVPTSADIRRIVVQILRDTGHAPIAQAYESYGEGRPTAQATLFPAGPVLVEIHARGEVRPWNRQRIAQALRREAGLDEATAAEIAAEVERTIFSLPRRRISTAEIRELVNQELLRRGLARRALGQLVIGMPKYDIARLISPPSPAEPALPDPTALARRIGEATLLQYALQEVCSPEVATAHLEGAIHVHGLDHPLKLFWIVPPLVLPAAPRTPRDTTARIASVLRHATALSSDTVELVRPEAIYADPAPGEEPYLAAEIAQVASEPRPAIQLSVDLGSSDPRTAGWLVEATSNLPAIQRGFLLGPAVFREPERSEALRAACSVALRHGACFALDRDPHLRAGRLARAWDFAAGPFAVAQAVSINAVQPILRGGGEDGFFRHLEAALEAAVRAHLDKRRFLQRFAPQDALPLPGLGRVPVGALRHVVGLCGLGTAAAMLAGDTAETADMERAAFRILSFVYAFLQHTSALHRVHLSLEDLPAGGAEGRFARIDAQSFPAASRWGPAAYAPGVAPATAARTPIERLLAEGRWHGLVASATLRLTAQELESTDLFALLLQAHAETTVAHVAVVV